MVRVRVTLTMGSDDTNCLFRGFYGRLGDCGPATTWQDAMFPNISLIRQEQPERLTGMKYVNNIYGAGCRHRQAGNRRQKSI